MILNWNEININPIKSLYESNRRSEQIARTRDIENAISDDHINYNNL